MAEDPNPALRAELLAALAVVEPQVRGLRDFSKVSLSPETIEAIRIQIEARSARANKIHSVLAALDAVVTARAALELDGYPALEHAEVFTTIYKEIQEQRRELELAAGIFEPEPVASNINVVLGSATPKSIS